MGCPSGEYVRGEEGCPSGEYVRGQEGCLSGEYVRGDRVCPSGGYVREQEKCPSGGYVRGQGMGTILRVCKSDDRRDVPKVTTSLGCHRSMRRRPTP